MTTTTQELETIEMRLLLEAIHARFHYDFRNYAMTSLERRVRLAMGKLSCSTISALQDRLLHDEEAFAIALGMLTIQVSDMFRDPEFFAAFRTLVVPELSRSAQPRVWIAGCATGEEVYSLAILLREENLLDRTRIYATDINESGLAIASTGIYAADRLDGFERNHIASGAKSALADHYVVTHDAAIFDPALRANTLFCDHSLATDAVFAAVDVVICRNVLIYFDTTLKTRTFQLFADALEPGGFLGLGTAEHASDSGFQPLAPEHKWFRRKP